MLVGGIYRASMASRPAKPAMPPPMMAVGIEAPAEELELEPEDSEPEPVAVLVELPVLVVVLLLYLPVVEAVPLPEPVVKGGATPEPEPEGVAEAEAGAPEALPASAVIRYCWTSDGSDENHAGVPVAKACSIRVVAAPGLVMATAIMELGRTWRRAAVTDSGLTSRCSTAGTAATTAARATKAAVTFIFNVVAGVVVTVDWNRRVLQEVINVRQRSSSNDLLYASNEG